MPAIKGTTTDPTTPAVFGDATQFEGVRGVSHAAGHGGVVGYNVDGSPNAGPGVYGESGEGEGVRGVSKAEWHGGVVGTNESGGPNAGPGVYGESKRGEGVRGVSHSADHAGVVGTNEKGAGVFGSSQNSEGVHGENTATSFVAGVTGIAVNQGGIGPGVLGQSLGSGPGVVGKALKDAGVIGFHGDPRLQETTVASDGAKAGVFGASDTGAGVLGYCGNPSVPAVYAFGGLRATALGKPLAGLFDGNVQVNGDLFLPGADCAEQFEIAEPEGIEEGSVVVIDREGALRESEEAYDRKVAGVISGAGNYRPGILLDKQQSQENRRPVALVGKVFCKVDAQYSPITVGDLLTTSPTPGHAMKAVDPARAFGAVIGKALGDLPAGKGLLPILVCLQ